MKIFDTARCDMNVKKSTVWKILRNLIFYNNNTDNLLTNWKKCPINKQKKFFFRIKWIDFEFVSECFYIFGNTGSEKIQACNRTTISWTTRKMFQRDMESFYKNKNFENTF